MARRGSPDKNEAQRRRMPSLIACPSCASELRLEAEWLEDQTDLLCGRLRDGDPAGAAQGRRQLGSDSGRAAGCRRPRRVSTAEGLPLCPDVRPSIERWNTGRSDRFLVNARQRSSGRGRSTAAACSRRRESGDSSGKPSLPSSPQSGRNRGSHARERQLGQEHGSPREARGASPGQPIRRTLAAAIAARRRRCPRRRQRRSLLPRGGSRRARSPSSSIRRRKKPSGARERLRSRARRRRLAVAFEVDDGLAKEAAAGGGVGAGRQRRRRGGPRARATSLRRPSARLPARWSTEDVRRRTQAEALDATSAETATGPSSAASIASRTGRPETAPPKRGPLRTGARPERRQAASGSGRAAAADVHGGDRSGGQADSTRSRPARSPAGPRRSRQASATRTRARAGRARPTRSRPSEREKVRRRRSPPSGVRSRRTARRSDGPSSTQACSRSAKSQARRQKYERVLQLPEDLVGDDARHAVPVRVVGPARLHSPRGRVRPADGSVLAVAKTAPRGSRRGPRSPGGPARDSRRGSSRSRPRAWRR